MSTGTFRSRASKGCSTKPGIITSRLEIHAMTVSENLHVDVGTAASQSARSRSESQPGQALKRRPSPAPRHAKSGRFSSRLTGGIRPSIFCLQMKVSHRNLAHCSSPHLLRFFS